MYYSLARYKKMERGERITILGHSDLYSDIQENLSLFLTDEQLRNRALIKRLTYDVVRSHFKFGIDVNEYFCYDFAHKKDTERSLYLSRGVKDRICCEVYGKDWVRKLSSLKNKYEFYTMAKAYFKRDAILIKDHHDIAVFKDFIHKHPLAFAKLESGRGGKGAFVLKAEDVVEKGPEMFFQELIADGRKWIIEEQVLQDERMAYWNKTSVNTVRVPSVMTSNGPVCFYPFMRFGKVGSVVDNACSGGFFVVVDGKTGIVITDAYDKRSHHYEKHPEHGDMIKGHVIPEWQELIKVAKDLHQSIFPDYKYIGFDFALTPKGWVVIEANWGHFSPLQVAINRGMKDDFIKILKS